MWMPNITRMLCKRASFCVILVFVTEFCMSIFSATLVSNAVNNAAQEKSPNYSFSFNCSELLMGQYICLQPAIDAATQSEAGCPHRHGTVKVACLPAPDIVCDGKVYDGNTTGFYKEIPCKWTNGHSFETALLLSIFLGMFGIDRFYLGYPAIGLLKFSTLGFFFLGQLVDILLIGSQIVTPADGSDYVIDYYGASIQRISVTNETYIKPIYDEL